MSMSLEDSGTDRKCFLDSLGAVRGVIKSWGTSAAPDCDVQRHGGGSLRYALITGIDQDLQNRSRFVWPAVPDLVHAGVGKRLTEYSFVEEPGYNSFLMVTRPVVGST